MKAEVEIKGDSKIKYRVSNEMPDYGNDPFF